MSTIIIKSDEKSNKLLKELAKQLGADVVTLKDDQYEDFILGNIIDSEKTGKDASRSDVFPKIQKEMIVRFDKSFLKALDKVKDPTALKRV
jgi:hypothetical protein